MACYSRMLLLLLLLSISFCSSTSFIFKEDKNGFARTERNLANSSLLCGVVNCLKGVCVDSLALPFYQCECDEGWTSPLNASWIPCVLPNCSINLGCNGSSSSAPPPPTASFSLCALPVCGNGECVPSSNSSLLYECKCDPGYTNLFNTSNGYCIQPCSLGGDCSSLNIALGGSPLSPPPPPSSSQNSSQGTSRRTYASNFMIVCGLLLLQMGWRFY